MNLNTVKTIWGYFISLAGKYTPLKFGGDSIRDVFNHLPISDLIHTSGQPTARQFRAISEAGFQVVINLLPENKENSLRGERELVRSLGMEYVHIPITFHPKEEDFEEFARNMESLAGRKTWIHCAANARVSAFLYRYRCTFLREDPESVKWDVREIWEPFGAWKEFISWN